jgi:hypothetical protein
MTKTKEVELGSQFDVGPKLNLFFCLIQTSFGTKKNSDRAKKKEPSFSLDFFF